MAKKNTKRKIIGLVSEITGDRIYYTRKNTQNTPEQSAQNQGADPTTKLIEMKKLLDAGVITQEEFDKLKAQILGL